VRLIYINPNKKLLALGARSQLSRCHPNCPDKIGTSLSGTGSDKIGTIPWALLTVPSPSKPTHPYELSV
jgi:hypothetical protein